MIIFTFSDGEDYQLLAKNSIDYIYWYPSFMCEDFQPKKLLKIICVIVITLPSPILPEFSGPT